MGNFIDLTGKRFGRLLVIERAENKGRFARWLCKCDCGKITISHGSNLRSGLALSCGCYRYERAAAAARKHNGKGTRLYRIWKNMRTRCHNPNIKQYNDYGGRGIKICEAWNDFSIFQDWALSNGYADNLTIDRIDCNGDYSPTNCRWATHTEQCRNKRNNHRIAGKTLSEWHELHPEIPYQTLVQRANDGYTIENIFNMEKRKTLQQIAGENDMNLHTLKSRLRRGMTIQQAIMTPLHKRTRKI